jgi:hypothetical protein
MHIGGLSKMVNDLRQGDIEMIRSVSCRLNLA